VLALPDKRVVVSGGGAIMAFGADGETQAQVRAPSWVGRLIDFGKTTDGTQEIAAYRAGSTMMGVVQLPSGDARSIDVGAPIATAVAGDRTVAILTTSGIRVATSADKEAKPIPGVPKILDLTRAPKRGILALYEDGGIAEIGDSNRIGGGSPIRLLSPKGAHRLLAADDQWAAVGPRAVVASAIGRFLPGDRRQLAVVTYSGHVALLDTADGTLLADLVWPDARDLAAADLDGDGHEELIVGASRFVTVLSGVQR
jgi:hypothetical protein